MNGSLVYLVFLSFLFFISLADYIKDNLNNYFFCRILLVFIFFCFIFIAGGRYYPDRGDDWSIYKDYFERSPKLGKYNDFNSSSFEPGFFILTSVIKLFTSHYVVFFILIETISCIILFLNINRYTKYRLVSLSIYFPLFFLSLDLIMIRSLLAVQLFFFSLRYIYDKKIVRYFVCILMASSVHISSIILFPLYFILNKYYKTRIIIMTIFLGIIITLFRIDILSGILRSIPSLDAIAYIYYKANSYLQSERFGSKRPISFAQIEYLVWFFILIKYRVKLSSFSRYFNIFFNLYFIYGILLFYFVGVNAFSGRLKFFFLFSIIFFIPYFIRLYKKYFSLALFVYYLYLVATTIYVLYKEESNINFYFGYKNYFFL